MTIKSLLPLLETTHRERERLFKEREAFLEQIEAQPNGDRPCDTAIVDSMIGFGPMVTAAVMGYCEAAIAARDLQHLRKRTGVAAVFSGSGKSYHIQQRYACSLTLRNAMYHAAHVAVMKDEHWRELYARIKSRGRSHGRALRGVADRMLSVLVAMLEKGELYDPSRWTKPRKTETPPVGVESTPTESNKEASPPEPPPAAAKARVKARGAKRSAQRGSASEH